MKRPPALTEDEIDARVEQWHSMPGQRESLHEFLGWTWEEYAHWGQYGKIPAVVAHREAGFTALVAAFNRDYRWRGETGTDCRLVATLRADGFVDSQIACVIHAIENTCHECWDAPRPCACSRDE